MVFTPLHPPGPTHSRTADYPPRALSRLALSQAHAEVADLATTGIPTVCDRYATAHDVVEFAARLVAAAREALDRAVVHACEIGGSWAEIADALALTADQAQERYATVIGQWQDTLAQPWQMNGSVLVSRLPAGAREPDQSARQLDQWCQHHVPPTSAARQSARRDGAIDRMVSAHLPARLTPTGHPSATSSVPPDWADPASSAEGDRR